MTKLCPDQIYTIPQQPAALTAPAPANDGALILDIVNTSDNCNDYNGTSNIEKYYADANYHVFVYATRSSMMHLNFTKSDTIDLAPYLNTRTPIYSLSVDANW